jgi:hypothetical protein
MKPLAANIWDRESHEHYVEPEWCSRRLFNEVRCGERIASLERRLDRARSNFPHSLRSAVAIPHDAVHI